MVRPLERIERVSGRAAGTPGVAAALEAVRERVRRACAESNRDPGGVAILAVTKGFKTEAIEAALAVGLREIGENYYQEAVAKFEPVTWPSGARKHFIGRIQRNKARRIAALFDVVQTVDHLEAAQALDLGAAGAGKSLDVLVQINIAADERAGVAPDNALELARELESCRNLRLRGIMAIGPSERSKIPPAFARAADCYRQMRQHSQNVNTFSLGMSGDLEEAVAAGATMIRLGTALFGPRPQEG